MQTPVLDGLFFCPRPEEAWRKTADQSFSSEDINKTSFTKQLCVVQITFSIALQATRTRSFLSLRLRFCARFVAVGVIIFARSVPDVIGVGNNLSFKSTFADYCRTRSANSMSSRKF